MKRGRTFCVLLLIAVAAPVAANAQQNIGATAATKNDVSRELSGAPGLLTTGDPVFRNEVVKTGTESTAKLVFLDSTNLAVGPISRVVLDRFVFEGGESNETVAVKLSKGIFRFTTGSLDKNAYSLTTSTAAIGVRGTVLDLAVVAGRTRVTLVEGRAIVCPVNKGGAFEQIARDCSHEKGSHCDCLGLDQPGQTADVSRSKGGGTTHASLSTTPVSFASFCSGSLCSASSYASVTNGGATFASAVNGPSDLDAGGGGGGGGAGLCGR
jgi:hypothetical protein